MSAQEKGNIAIIVAAGTGRRVGGETPKQYLPVRGKPMLRHSYGALSSHPDIDAVYVVIGGGQETHALEALSGLTEPILVGGGAERRESVLAGLNAIAANGGAENVLIHDAARPFLSAKIIDKLLAELQTKTGAIPALPVVDSLARGDGIMTATVDRAQLWRVQTPQAFHFNAIYSAHQSWDPSQEATDDARMAMAMGHEVAIVEGDERLAKYTFAADFDDDGSIPMIRVGNGYDVHKLEAGEELWLCGIQIGHTHGLSGHSDADVAIHALVDAILGALALGDIGDHFPPSDVQWKGASSDQFLIHAMKLAGETGYALSNADVTIICEAPKIGPHKSAMQDRLAEIMQVDKNRISVKATTTEKLGFTGRREGIAAQASVAFLNKGGV